MRAENKVLIISVLNHLKERDPEWAHVKMLPKFKTLYQGWAEKCLRQHKRNRVYFSNKWKDGWLSKADFKDFLEYALQ